MTLDELSAERYVEIRVVCFPSDKAMASKRARDLEHARQLCRELRDFAPLIEERVVTYTTWRVVENTVETRNE